MTDEQYEALRSLVPRNTRGNRVPLGSMARLQLRLANEAMNEINRARTGNDPDAFLTCTDCGAVVQRKDGAGHGCARPNALITDDTESPADKKRNEAWPL